MIWRDGELLLGSAQVVSRHATFGAFTTVGCDLGRACLWSRHHDRLAASIIALGGPKGDLLPAENEVNELLAANHCDGPSRLRVTAWRDRLWSVEATVTPTSRVGPSLAPLKLVTTHWASAPPMAGHKSLARLAWDLAREQAWTEGCDDALLVDGSDLVLETSIANVFARHGSAVTTPPAPDACLPGVMRGWLIDHLGSLGLEVEAAPLPLDELLSADEVWVSNAVIGIRRVATVDDRTWTDWPVHAKLATLEVPAPGWWGQTAGAI